MIDIELVSVHKSFGASEVLTDVSLRVSAGEVVCLLGDNGAGKSTLVQILSGVYMPTSGVVRVDGERIQLRSPRHAQRLGISTVFQDVDTFPLLSISQNFFLGREITKGRGLLRRIDVRASDKRVLEQLRSMGISRVESARTLVGTLSGGQRQALAICRAAYFGARALVLDEPTSALGVKEAAIVLRLIARLRQENLATVLVTHNVHHALAIGDRFVVLDQGKVRQEFVRGERSEAEVMTLMAGGEDALALSLDTDHGS